MVTAGQWQAVKDTLSRPKGRSPTTSDTSGNPTTTTAYNNLFITLHWIQQPSWYDSLDTTTNYSTLHDQYNNLYVMKIDRISNLYAMPPIQQPSLLLYNNRLSKLLHDLMILLANLIHYYTTMYTATLPIWYLCYNNQLSRLDHQSLWYDTDTLT